MWFVCSSRFHHPSSLVTGHVCWCDKCTLCDRECQDTEAEGSQATRMSWPSYIPSSHRPFHFPSLRCLLRFVSFPLAPVWAHLAPPCGTRVLLTYSSPLGFEKFSLFWHSWDHFSGRVTEWQSSGILSGVQDHQEIQEMPGVVPGETGKGDKHTCSFIGLAQQR